MRERAMRDKDGPSSSNSIFSSSPGRRKSAGNCSQLSRIIKDAAGRLTYYTDPMTKFKKISTHKSGETENSLMVLHERVLLGRATLFFFGHGPLSMSLFIHSSFYLCVPTFSSPFFFFFLPKRNKMVRVKNK